jgi:hypothetical protein
MVWLRADGDNHGVARQPGMLLPAALERWCNASRSALAARGVTATPRGPSDAPGMDPVYILRLDSDRRETEVSLFREGTILISGFDKHTLERIPGSAVQVSSGDDLVATLARSAECA